MAVTINILSFFSFGVFCIYCAIGIYVVLLDRKSHLNRVFFLVCTSLAIWSFGITLFYNSQSKEQCWFWYKYFAVGWYATPALMLHFFLVLTGKNKFPGARFAWPLLYAPPLLLTALTFICKTAIIADFSINWFGWRPVYSLGSLWYWVFAAYFLAYLSGCIIVLLLWRSATASVRLRKQSGIILISFSITILAGGMTGIVLPVTHHEYVPPIVPIIVVIWVLSIWYAITRYRLMVLTPRVAADEILSRVTDMVFLVQADGTIVKMNRCAENIVRQKKNLVGASLEIVTDEPEIIREAIASVASGEKEEQCAVNFIRKGGGSFPVEISLSPIKDKNGEIIGIVATAHDMRQTHELLREITRRMRVENELRKSEQRYRFLLENTNDVIYRLDTAGIITYVSPHISQYGYTQQELINSYFMRIVCHDDRESLLRDFAKLMMTGEEVPSSFRICDAQGNPHWMEDNARIIRNENGSVEGVSGSLRDITRRKEVEEELKQSEQMWQFVLEGSGDCVWEWDIRAGKIHYSNHLLELYGYNENDSVCAEDPLRIWRQMLHPDDRKMVYDTFMRHLKGETPYYRTEHRKCCKNGEYKWILDRGKIIQRDENGKPLRMIGTNSDISERKRAEESLVLSEEKFNKAFHSSPVAMTINFLENGEYIDVNDTMLELGGYTRDEFLHRTVFDLKVFRYSEDRKRLMRGILRDGSVRNLECDFRTKLGEFRTGLISADIVTIGGRKCVITSGIDMSERKRTEAKIAEEKERLSVTLRSIGDGVITTDMHGRIALINRVAEQLTGWSSDEAVGRPVEDVFVIIHEKTRERRPNPVTMIIDGGDVVEMSNHTILVARDGAERFIADNGAPIMDRKSNVIGVVLVFRDITEKSRMEEELRRAQKLESIGVLAGGIAHDFNNILMGMLGNISLAKMAMQQNEEEHSLLTDAETAGLRAKDLTQQLLTFSRGGAPVRRAASIQSLLRDTANFVLRGSNVRCSFAISDDLWPVNVDEGQISQVIHNLVLNADQAMPEGGVIEISAENVTVSQAAGLSVRPAFPESGNYVHISIRDRGVGIHVDNIHKIFDPYFTTRAKGSGLGLSIVYSIVQKHEGHIDLESTEGKGTTFHVYLPAADTVAAESASPRNGVEGGKGLVVIMDDDDAILKSVTAMLKYLGYSVITAHDGKELIDIYTDMKKRAHPVEAVIMDLTIPGGMGGSEAIIKLRALDPAVRAIVSSGYSNDPVLANYRQYGFCGVITKPYRIEELSAVIRDVIQAVE